MNSDILLHSPLRTLCVMIFEFDTAHRRSTDQVQRRHTSRPVLHVFGAIGLALAIASCGSDAPAASVQATTTPPVATAAPSTEPTPLPLTEPTTVEPEPADTMTETTLAMPSEPPSIPCRRLTDFDDGQGWVIVNDGVMGGRSNGAVAFADAAMQFTGDVVTAGGGFTSVRLPLAGEELTGSESLVLRVRADERSYGLTLADSAQAGRRAISHGAGLTTDGPTDADGWQTTELSYEELQPSVFGQSLDAPPFEPDLAIEIGIIISDGIDGPFALEVDWIDACRGQ